MAISNQNYVCITCRKSCKRYWSSPICSRCHNIMTCIGKRWRVPKISDDKEWEIIKVKFGQQTTRT